VRAISGYDYSSGAVGADGNGNRTPSQQSGHVDVITFTEYRSVGHKCDGTALENELVIEYEHKSTDDRWTVKARTRTPFELGATVFDMLAGITALESGNRRSFDGRTARALVAPWNLPAGAQGGPPAGTSQSLCPGGSWPSLARCVSF
jgi:hypothetical protein